MIGDAQREQQDVLLRELHDYVNRGWFDDLTHLAKKMVKDHPTLVQQYTNLCLAFLREVAGLQYVDARNEQAKLLAVKLVETMKQELATTYLPLI